MAFQAMAQDFDLLRSQLLDVIKARLMGSGLFPIHGSQANRAKCVPSDEHPSAVTGQATGAVDTRFEANVLKYLRGETAQEHCLEEAAVCAKALTRGTCCRK